MQTVLGNLNFGFYSQLKELQMKSVNDEVCELTLFSGRQVVLDCLKDIF